MNRALMKELTICARFHGLNAAERDQSIALAHSVCAADPTQDFETVCKSDLCLNSVKHPTAAGFSGSRGDIKGQDDGVAAAALDAVLYKAWLQREATGDDSDDSIYEDERAARLIAQRIAFDRLHGVKKTMRNALVRMRNQGSNEHDLARWMPQIQRMREGVLV